MTRSLAVLLAFVCLGCGGARGPVEELKQSLEALGNPTIAPPRLGREVYGLLDEASRAAVDSRAKALAEATGRPIEPYEILQVRGLARGERLTSIELATPPAPGPTGEERATLELSLAPLSFVGAAPTTAAPRKLRLEVVRQSGRWRIAFPELGKLVGELPIQIGGAPANGPDGGAR